MSNDEINIALAKWDGWTCRNCGKGPDECTGCDFDDYPDYVLPSYTTDLNSVWQLEEKLNKLQKLNYVSFLHDVTETKISIVTNGLFDFCHAHATARQRCEALLRTLNLWND